MVRSRKRYVYILISAAIVVIAALLLIFLHKSESPPIQKYLASRSTGIPYYYFNEEEHRLIKSSELLPRGIQVTDLEENYTENGIEYAMIAYDGNSYYIDSQSMVDDQKDVIQETEVWVRTSATVYTNPTGPEITSFARKGDCLEVVGFDEMQADGSIHKYKIHFTDSNGEDVTGWVYGKYLLDNQEDALAVNAEIQEIHKDRIYSGMELYGGQPTTLDWYPVEKPSFASNPICETASAMYINIEGVKNIDEYIEIAKNNGVNAMVIDVKDGESVAYPCEEIKEISPSSYASAYYTAKDYQEAIRKCLDAGIYCIGRIVAFKDYIYSGDHPETCITSPESSVIWPSAYSRDCWCFNVTLARAAAQFCGFNEIQYDYVRFPEESYSMSLNEATDFRNEYDEEKAEAIQNFCYYAADALHEIGVYLSVDVFGECVNSYVTAYGQYFPSMSLVVDAISAMPYPDHYGRTEDTWTDPYAIMYSWAQKASQRQSEIPTPAIARTWVAAYDVPFWSLDVLCDASYIAREVQALVDGGITGGFITWNYNSNLDKYRLIAPAWNKTYTPS